MWGDHAMDANDKAIYGKLNAAQSVLTTSSTVWRKGPNELQTYEAPATADDFAKASVRTWRLVNDATHFKFQGG
jgi:hypothetical protein